jgi:cation-transporting ATPase 13A2
MYLYQDLFTVFVLALTMGNTPSSRTLTFKRPSGRLFSMENMALTFGFIAITFGLQAHVFLLVRKEPWYDTADYPAAMQYDDPDAFNYDYEETNSGIPETTTVFLMSCLQYSAVATIFSIGYPYKLATWRNPLFTVWLAFTTICGILLFFSVADWIYWLIGMQVLPTDWVNRVFGWSVLSFVLYFVWWGVLIAARYKGALRWIAASCCGKRTAQHKRLRVSWREQFGLPAMPTRVVGPAVAATGGGDVPVKVVS